MSEGAMKAAHLATWWLHMVLVFGFLAWAPYTKMAHVLTSTLNIYTARLAPIGANLRKVDFDSEEKLGIHSLAGFSWKDLLDFDACTECGRCTEACPAHRVGKQLSPRDIILDLQRLARALRMQISRSRTSAQRRRFRLRRCGNARLVPRASRLALYRSSRCPRLSTRARYLVMEDAEFPETMQQALTSVETRSHPFAAPRFRVSIGHKACRLPRCPRHAGRTCCCGWAAAAHLWSGIKRSCVRWPQLLTKAGVSFAILGREEKCTGDPARRIGNEFLFEQLAQENIATLDRYQAKTIVTSCPHCFNTLRNEYPQFGGHYEVFHHSEYLAKLVREGKLSVETPTEKQVTFHDPCYLGRHNGVYDAPRELVQISTRSPAIEMAQSRQNGFCCGGGGGMSFIDEPADKRVNQERARQVLETGAEIVAVGCPFCTTMLEDGINAKKGDREIQVLDVAELLWQAVAQKESS